jgi:hypothetical protein
MTETTTFAGTAVTYPADTLIYPAGATLISPRQDEADQYAGATPPQRLSRLPLPHPQECLNYVPYVTANRVILGHKKKIL